MVSTHRNFETDIRNGERGRESDEAQQKLIWSKGFSQDMEQTFVSTTEIVKAKSG